MARSTIKDKEPVTKAEKRRVSKKKAKMTSGIGKEINRKRRGD